MLKKPVFRGREEVGSKPGEGWKRLQLRAETRKKNYPEKYSQIAMHKFPLRDWGLNERQKKDVLIRRYCKSFERMKCEKFVKWSEIEVQ